MLFRLVCCNLMLSHALINRTCFFCSTGLRTNGRWGKTAAKGRIVIILTAEKVPHAIAQ